MTYNEKHYESFILALLITSNIIAILLLLYYYTSPNFLALIYTRRFQSQISIDSCRGHSLLGITPTATRPRQDRDRPLMGEWRHSNMAAHSVQSRAPGNNKIYTFLPDCGMRGRVYKKRSPYNLTSIKLLFKNWVENPINGPMDGG